MSLLEPFFANPLLAAAGAACAAAPVLIHLLNRLRFRRVKFAAMAFLLESDERNRRRLLLEQILLLAARVLLVLLIAALLGRLLVDPATLAIVGQESPTHHVYLIDDSASMRASSDDAGTVFGLAEAVVRRDLELIGKRAAADTVTVLTASAATDGDAILSDRRVEPAAMAELESAFATLEAGYGSPPLPAAVAAAAARLTQGDGRGRRLVVVTDFRAVDWGDRGGPLSAVTEAEAEGVSAEIVAVGSAPGPNLAVTAVRGDFGSLAADVPVRIAVAVTNRSAVAADDVTVSVFKDADRLPVMGTVERIGPGETAEAFLDMAFPAGDASTLRFEIEADEFRPDDTFRVGISVPETRSVLIVDGSPETDAAVLLGDALAPVPGIAGLTPDVITPTALGEIDLSAYAVVYLHDVAEMTPDAAERLAEYVGKGGGVAAIVGPSVSGRADAGRAIEYADLMAAVPDGRKVERPKRPGDESPDVVFAGVGRFAPFAGRLAEYLRPIRVMAVAGSSVRSIDEGDREDDGVADAAVVASCPRPDGSSDPLLVIADAGDGRVATLLTPLDDRWADWSKHFIFVPLIHELTRHLAGAGRPPGVVGDGLTVELSGADDFEVTAEAPDGTVVVPDRSADGLSASIPTETPGRYVLKASSDAGIDRVVDLVVNTPRREGQTELAAVDGVRDLLGEDSSVSIRVGSRDEAMLGPDGGDVTTLLATLAVALSVVELWTAAKLSRHGDRGPGLVGRRFGRRR